VAEVDSRFEQPASLADALQRQLLSLLPTSTIHALPARRPRRSPRTTARLIRAVRNEQRALQETCTLAGQQGFHIERRQLADLRLGERTRRIFHEAGLTTIEDVANLPPERAVEIPHLAPTSLSELRAAILFALEVDGHRPRVALPPPGYADDLFERLEKSVNLLPPRERDVLVMRAGVRDRVHSTEEVARTLGTSPEQIETVEDRALSTLLAQPACVEASWRIAELCSRLGLSWDDERLPTAIAAWYPNTRASFARLAAWRSTTSSA